MQLPVLEESDSSGDSDDDDSVASVVASVQKKTAKKNAAGKKAKAVNQPRPVRKTTQSAAASRRVQQDLDDLRLAEQDAAEEDDDFEVSDQSGDGHTDNGKIGGSGEAHLQLRSAVSAAVDKVADADDSEQDGEDSDDESDAEDDGEAPWYMAMPVKHGVEDAPPGGHINSIVGMSIICAVSSDSTDVCVWFAGVVSQLLDRETRLFLVRYTKRHSNTRFDYILNECKYEQRVILSEHDYKTMWVLTSLQYNSRYSNVKLI